MEIAKSVNKSPVGSITFAYRISANSFRGNYSFLEVGVRQLFKGGNYSRAETIRGNTVCQVLTALYVYSALISRG